MKNRAGFTLVELMMVVAIIGIVAAIAIPTIFSWLPNIRMRGASRDLFLDMQRAKMEAIKRNANVVIAFTAVVCPGLPPLNAVPAAGGSYTVFIDDGAGVGGIAKDNIQNGSELTLAQKTMPQNVALCAQSFLGSRAGFLPSGLPVANNIGSATLNNNKGRSAIVSLTLPGGIRVQ